MNLKQLFPALLVYLCLLVSAVLVAVILTYSVPLPDNNDDQFEDEPTPVLMEVHTV